MNHLNKAFPSPGKAFLYAQTVRKIKAAQAYHEILNERSRFDMEEKPVATGAVTNVFKNGQMPTKEEYTKIWIEMVNHIERLKANQ